MIDNEPNSNNGNTPPRPPTPVPPKVRQESIPEELRALDRWVVWRFEYDGHDFTKPPLDAKTLVIANKMNPAVWTDYSTAFLKYETENLDGVGLCLAGSGYVGIDCDDCRDPVTGDLEAWAQEILAELGPVYAEVSPSGTGIKIIARGTLPPGRRVKRLEGGQIEFHDKAYFTITGHIVDDCATITDSTDAIARVHERIFGKKDELQATSTPSAPGGHEMTSDGLAARARAYIAKMPSAISGQNGHGQTFAVACVLRDFGLCRADAFILLEEYSARCLPPWSARELNHKLDGAFSQPVNVNRFLAALQPSQAYPRSPSVDTTQENADVDDEDLHEQAESVYQPFPVCALPPRCAAFVIAVAAAMDCDPAFVAPHVLALIAGLLGSKYRVKVKNAWIEFPIIWIVVISESGTMKTPAFKAVIKLLEQLQAELFAAYELALEQYQDALGEWKAAQKLQDSEALGARPQRPICRRLYVSDTTVEKLAVLLHENPAGFLLARDELLATVTNKRRDVGVVVDASPGSHFHHKGHAIVLQKSPIRSLCQVAYQHLAHFTAIADECTECMTTLGELYARVWHNQFRRPSSGSISIAESR